MNTTCVERLFRDHGETEYKKFDRIPDQARRHPRPDICAFLYLHDRFGGAGNMVDSASHDQIFLDIDHEDIERMTADDVIYLSRCGVGYEGGSLYMFV